MVGAILVIPLALVSGHEAQILIVIHGVKRDRSPASVSNDAVATVALKASQSHKKDLCVAPARAMNRPARDHRAERNIEDNMTNTEANTAATVGAPGTTVAPENASSKKRTSREKGAPRSPKTTHRRKAKA